MPFGLQPLDVVAILVIGLLVFGPKQLPKIGRYLGKTITEFRTGTQELTKSIRGEDSETVYHAPSPEPAAPANTRFCTQCGAPNSATGSFCTSCGAVMNEVGQNNSA